MSKLGDLNDEVIEWDIKSTKIQGITMIASGIAESLLESLGKCAIKELVVSCWKDGGSGVLQKFLKLQEKNLKKLAVRSSPDYPNVLKDLRLEHFEFVSSTNITLLESLKHQVDLKTLQISIPNFSDEILNTICELKHLEALELNGRVRNSNSLKNLYKLQKLQRLKVGLIVSENFLEHLRFGVFNNFKELEAYAISASVESVEDLKRITPNLRKIKIQEASSRTTNTLLKTLPNLESLEIQYGSWKILSKRVYPKIKHLVIRPSSGWNFSAERLTKQFPNLECLQIFKFRFNVTEQSFITLLSGLKQLKTLTMEIRSDTELDSESVLPCFEEHGKQLVKVYVDAVEKSYEDRYYIDSFTIEKEPYECFSFSQFSHSFSYDEFFYDSDSGSDY